MLAHIGQHHKLVYIDSPNNPTGQAIPLSDIRRVVALAAQLSIPVIIDEAYGGLSAPGGVGHQPDGHL